jgi:hypothetical protein
MAWEALYLVILLSSQGRIKFAYQVIDLSRDHVKASKHKGAFNFPYSYRRQLFDS